MSTPKEAAIERLLTHQVEEVIVRESLEKKLKSGKKLRIKLGADPSRPDLHLGHAVVLRKLKEFQDLGHTVVFVIGDFTGLIGDPTGKSKTRPMLTEAEIRNNAKTYFKQVGSVLDTKKCEIRFNSEWLGKLRAADFIFLAAKFTVARILERDDFAKRLKEHADIHVHELMYPMLQAQDSIDLKADVEIGGTDQKFNMLAGRDLARRLELPEQDVITCPLLVGTDGVQKMSKSLGNYIGLTDSAEEMFGKTMSVADSALGNYLELAADYTKEEVAKEKAALAAGENPRDVKMRLAFRIAAMYHGEKAAGLARESFVSQFQKKQAPTEMPVMAVEDGQPAATVCAEIFAISKSEARRLIEQGGIRFDGQAVKDPLKKVVIPAGGIVVNKGKLQYVRIKKG